MRRANSNFFLVYLLDIVKQGAVSWGDSNRGQWMSGRCTTTLRDGVRDTMKTGLLALLVVVLCAGTSFAGSCVTNSYDNYIGTDCTIVATPPGDVKTFSNFTYSTSGTSHMSADQITVNPIAFPYNAGFLFNAPWSAGSHQSQDSLIGFTVTVTSGSALINDLSLLMFGGGFSGTGSASVSETYCLGDTFSDGCAHGTIGTLSTFLNGTGSKLIDTVSFAGVSEVDVEKDILVSGGENGFAVLSGVENLISEDPLPEPGSLAILGSGLISLAGLLGKRLFA